MSTQDDDPSSARFWERMYREGKDGWELGAPAPPLARALGTVPPGERAAVLGCGRGHEARMLARAGWRAVVAVDFAQAALAEARALSASVPEAERARIEWRLQDVFTLGATDAGRFDLCVEHTCFCAIDPRRRPAWRAVVEGVLRPGGTLVALFSFTHPRVGGPPFSTSREEVEALFPPDGGLALEAIEVPADSTPKRAGDELLVRARRR